MKSHDIDYEIIGNSMQVVEVHLDPEETVIAEAGALTYMQQGVNFESKMGDGSDPDQGLFGSLFSAGKRMIMGESIFTTHFTNKSSVKRSVAFGAPYPGTIMPLNLVELGGQVTCQKDAFLCAARGTSIDITFSKRLGSGLFGGEGFILEKLTGDGIAFIQAGGTLIEKQLDGDKLLVDTGCIVGFTDGIEYDIERAGGLKSMLFGGEGLFLATLQGQGTVWLQSLPFSRMADRILAHAPTAGGKEKGED